MHESCLEFGASHLTAQEVRGKRVLEVGAFDVNGSLRPYVQSLAPQEYVGTDLRSGPGVDVVCAGEQVCARFGEERFDVVICTETLEHVEDWRAVISALKRVLAPGGVLLLTARGPGYPRHDYPGDHWRFTPEDMRTIFADFRILALEPDPQVPGVLLKAAKPADPDGFVEADLAGYAVEAVR